MRREDAASAKDSTKPPPLYRHLARRVREATELRHMLCEQRTECDLGGAYLHDGAEELEPPLIEYPQDRLYSDEFISGETASKMWKMIPKYCSR